MAVQSITSTKIKQSSDLKGNLPENVLFYRVLASFFLLQPFISFIYRVIRHRRHLASKFAGLLPCES